MGLKLISFTNFLANNFHYKIKTKFKLHSAGDAELRGVIVHFMPVYIVETL